MSRDFGIGQTIRTILGRLYETGHSQKSSESSNPVPIPGTFLDMSRNINTQVPGTFLLVSRRGDVELPKVIQPGIDTWHPW